MRLWRGETKIVSGPGTSSFRTAQRDLLANQFSQLTHSQAAQESSKREQRSALPQKINQPAPALGER